MRQVAKAVIVAALVVLAGCAGAGGGDGATGQPAAGGGDAGGGVSGDGASGSSDVGVAVGGAQDANAFRRNIENGHVPQPTDLSHEGLFHDYYFDTAHEGTCERRFCPSYSTAVVRDPISNETERFVSVGLNTGLTQEDVERDAINLVVVVDTSGSMDSRFDEYHRGEDSGDAEATKMAVARDAVRSLTENLGEDDRLGVVTFNDRATVVQDLQRIDETDVDGLREEVGSMQAGGGTDLDSGMTKARELVGDAEAETDERDTRIVYVTDAQPNAGETSGPALGERVKEYADEGIHTTVIGVGLDFNSEFTDQVATTEGANYYAVDSPTAFRERMDETFSYMVTPLAYNLTLRAENGGGAIEHVYGTPYDGGDAELISASTLFPSRKENNRTEGGVILLELADGVERVRLVAAYEDPDRERHEVVRNVTVEGEAPRFDSTGVRKAVALTEYANLLRNWMVHERADGEPDLPGEDGSIEHREYADNWEQQPVDLQVTAPYDDRIAAFVPYFRSHVTALESERMEQDLAVLERLGNESDTSLGGTAAATDSPASTDSRASTDDARAGGATSGGTGPTATDAATAESTNAGLFGGLGTFGPLVGLVNLALTVVIGAYGVTQKRRSRGANERRR